MARSKSGENGPGKESGEEQGWGMVDVRKKVMKKSGENEPRWEEDDAQKVRGEPGKESGEEREYREWIR